MPAALPWITAGLGIYSVGRDAGLWGPKPPEPASLPPPPPVLDFAQARDMAQEVLDPLYRDVLQNRLQSVQRGQIQRGFFGQLPGADQMTRAAADVESNRVAQIGSLAMQLQGQTQDQAARHAALQMQAHQQAMQAHQSRPDPMQSVAGTLGAFGQVANLFPGAMDSFNQTIGGWFGGGGQTGGPASAQPVNLDTVQSALQFWSPQTGVQGMGPGQSPSNLAYLYPYGNMPF